MVKEWTPLGLPPTDTDRDGTLDAIFRDGETIPTPSAFELDMLQAAVRRLHTDMSRTDTATLAACATFNTKAAAVVPLAQFFNMDRMLVYFAKVAGMPVAVDTRSRFSRLRSLGTDIRVPGDEQFTSARPLMYIEDASVTPVDRVVDEEGLYGVMYYQFDRSSPDAVKRLVFGWYFKNRGTWYDYNPLKYPSVVKRVSNEEDMRESWYRWGEVFMYRRGN
jgi:hypothetical protein